MNDLHKQTLKTPTGDPVLDLLACVWASAFTDAQTDHQARADIVEFFGLETLVRLYRRGAIAWDPGAVALQLTLEV